MWLRPSPDWRELTFWALDFETSGLEPRRDVILSVGMVPIRAGRIRWGERFYRTVRPERAEAAHTDAVLIHGLMPDSLAAAAPLAEVFDEIDERLAGHVLLVHYGRLDVGMLRAAAKSLGRRWRPPPVVDTLHLLAKLSRRLHTLDPFAKPLGSSLTDARADLGLPPHAGHDALHDALATAELFLALRARLELGTLRQLH